MPFAVPLTTATAAYVPFRGGGVYESGTVFCANGMLELVLIHGPSPGRATESGPFVLPPGFATLAAGAGAHGRGDYVVGFEVRAYGGVLSSPAQEFWAVLGEPGSAILGPSQGFLSEVSSSGVVS